MILRGVPSRRALSPPTLSAGNPSGQGEVLRSVGQRGRTAGRLTGFGWRDQPSEGLGRIRRKRENATCTYLGSQHLPTYLPTYLEVSEGVVSLA